MTLAELLDSIGTGLGLPELGLSESLAGGPTQYTGVTPQSQSAGYSYQPGGIISPIAPQTPSQYTYSDNGGQILGANTQNTGGGGGGNVPTSGGGGGDNSADLVRRALESRLNGIKERLALMRGEGIRQKGVAQGVRDELIGNIGNRYGGLRTEAKTTFDNTNAGLAEADRGTVRDYAINQGSMNTASENTMAKNRALARALGFGNSSYYQNTQDNARNQLLDKTSALTNERTTKLGDIKRDVAGANTWYGQKTTDIANEEATLKSEADRNYQDTVGKLLFNEQNYGIDQVDAAEQAQVDYGNQLNSIAQYIANKNNANTGYNTVASNQSTGISKYGTDAASKLASTLANTDALQASANPTFASIQGGDGAYTTTAGGKIVDPKKKKVVNPLDEYVYGGNPNTRSYGYA